MPRCQLKAKLTASYATKERTKKKGFAQKGMEERKGSNGSKIEQKGTKR